VRRKFGEPAGLVATTAARRKDEVPSRNCGFLGVACKPSSGTAGRGQRAASVGSRRWTLCTVLAGFATFGCGTPATFHITAPSSTVAGSPFTITVTAMVGGSRDTVINSPVHFTSSDSAAILPKDYYFTANDAGSHTFTNGVTLMTSGSQSITGTDPGAPGLNGSVNVTVMATAGATRSE
jgi:hypothetical protein